MATSVGESSIDSQYNNYFDDDLDDFLEVINENEAIDKTSEEICDNVSVFFWFKGSFYIFLYKFCDRDFFCFCYVSKNVSDSLG